MEAGERWRAGGRRQVSGIRCRVSGIRGFGSSELQPRDGVQYQDSRFRIRDGRFKMGKSGGRALLGPTSGVRATLLLWRFQFPVSSFACIGGCALRLLLWRFQFPVSSFAYIGGPR
jgi:hypothetical protein